MLFRSNQAAVRVRVIRAMVIAVRTPASASNDQWTHPVAASSEYTKPVSTPRNARPLAMYGCPNTELTPGNPNAHLSLSLGAVWLVSPDAREDWKRVFAGSAQPFHEGAMFR